MKWFTDASKLTHVLAVAIVAAYGFFQTPAGQAVLTQYPKLVALSTALGLLVTLYINPRK